MIVLARIELKNWIPAALEIEDSTESMTLNINTTNL